MKGTSVVIPVYNNWAGCHQLLFDLYKNCSLIEEVIIVDDASPNSDVQTGLAWWKTTNMLPITTIRNKENRGFTVSANIGLNFAVEDVVHLISTDVRVHKDVVQSGKQLLTLEPRYLIGGRYLDWDTGWNFGQPYLEGWYLCATKKAWEELGYFDEVYAPYDMEDVDLSVKAVKSGYSLFHLAEGHFTHEGAKSIGYTEARENITKRNKEAFRKKWNL